MKNYFSIKVSQTVEVDIDKTVEVDVDQFIDISKEDLLEAIKEDQELLKSLNPFISFKNETLLDAMKLELVEDILKTATLEQLEKFKNSLNGVGI